MVLDVLMCLSSFHTQGVLPSLVLLAFLLFIPYLLAFMCKAAGLVSRSQVDFKVITLFFYFQVEGGGKEAQERGRNCNSPTNAKPCLF